MAEVEIGIGKSGRRAFGFDDIAIVPSRRTRDPEDVDISWEIDAYRFDLPLMAAADSTVKTSPTAEKMTEEILKLLLPRPKTEPALTRSELLPRSSVCRMRRSSWRLKRARESSS